MDPSTLIGVGLALGAIVVSLIMDGGNLGAMFLIPPMILVFGGTIGAAVAGGVLSDAKGLPKNLIRGLTAKVPTPRGNVEVICAMADHARRNGLLSLESDVQKIEDPFLRRALEMAVDGGDPEDVAAILAAEIESKRREDGLAAKLFHDMGGYAPTIGIIGTVLGLVHVLGSLTDPSSLGPKIASAFVATLWGVMSANLFWFPMSNRIKRVMGAETLQMEVVIEGVLAIMEGANPRNVRAKLHSMLPDASADAAEKSAA